MVKLLFQKSPSRPTLEKLLASQSIHFVAIGFTINQLPVLFSRSRNVLVVIMFGETPIQVRRVADVPRAFRLAFDQVNVMHSTKV